MLLNSLTSSAPLRQLLAGIGGLIFATGASAVPTLNFDGTLDYVASSGALTLTAELSGYQDISVTPTLGGSLMSLSATLDSSSSTPLGFGFEEVTGNFIGGTATPDLSIVDGSTVNLLEADIISLSLVGLSGPGLPGTSGTLEGFLTPLSGLLLNDFTNPSSLIALVVNLDISFSAGMFLQDFSGLTNSTGAGNGIQTLPVPEPTIPLLFGTALVLPALRRLTTHTTSD